MRYILHYRLDRNTNANSEIFVYMILGLKQNYDYLNYIERVIKNSMINVLVQNKGKSRKPLENVLQGTTVICH